MSSKTKCRNGQGCDTKEGGKPESSNQDASIVADFSPSRKQMIVADNWFASMFNPNRKTVEDIPLIAWVTTKPDGIGVLSGIIADPDYGTAYADDNPEFICYIHASDLEGGHA